MIMLIKAFGLTDSAQVLFSILSCYVIRPAYVCLLLSLFVCGIGNQGEIGFQSQERYGRHGSSRNQVW